MRISVAIVSAFMGLLFLGACATTGSDTPPAAANGGPVKYIVKADTSPFFKYGPAQANGPDFRLKKDEVVTMVERRYGYSRVIDPDGDAGYVPTDDLAPAPVQPPALASVPKKTGHGSSRGSAPDFEQPNDSPLPSAQPPSEVPAPSFRY